MTCYASKVHVHHFDGHNISSFYRIGLIKYPPLANSIHVLKHSITINLQPDGMRSLEDINTRSLKLCIVMWFLMDINTRSLGLHIDIRTMKDIITRAFGLTVFGITNFVFVSFNDLMHMHDHRSWTEVNEGYIQMVFRGLSCPYA